MTKENDIRYFYRNHDGFRNTGVVMASDDEKVIQAMHKRWDDGMAESFDEISEKEAKRLLYANKANPDIETAIYNSDREYVPYPKWEDLQHFLVLNAKLDNKSYM